MYIPNHFKMKTMSDCHKLISEFGFGIIVSSPLSGTHLPFLLNKDEGDFGTLYAHCARSNPHWKTLEGNETLVIFNGPHSYISPRWYIQTPAVPTWNYAAVHAYGKVTLLTKEQTLKVVNDAVKKYEPDAKIYKGVMTEEYNKRLLSGIVGFKIVLTKIEGTQKLGQHKKQSDQQSVFQALSKSSHPSDIELANYMSAVDLGLGK